MHVYGLWQAMVTLTYHTQLIYFDGVYYGDKRKRQNVSNHRDLKSLFKLTKKNTKLFITGPLRGNPPETDGLPHKGPVMLVWVSTSCSQPAIPVIVTDGRTIYHSEIDT